MMKEGRTGYSVVMKERRTGLETICDEGGKDRLKDNLFVMKEGRTGLEDNLL